MNRKNKKVMMKVFRFTPDFVENMEHILYLCRDEFPTMTSLVTSSVERTIKEKRKRLEDQGVAWSHLRPGIKKSLTKKEVTIKDLKDKVKQAEEALLNKIEEERMNDE